ncbi:Lrp/AsnC family transcriptional regulator [Pedobacter sp.]|uniref:Lrp/AsnC family transcriptional regulator n=1 Tax=Pedobacter sp. TaxID=1411316 RepID=UPI003BAAC591
MPLENKLLDTTDKSILNLLQQDGAMTYKEIAGKVRKSMTNVVERIKFLRENGFIHKTVAIVNIEKVRSVFVAFPHIQLLSHSMDIINEFQNEMIKHPEVMECYYLTGQFDFMIKIAVPDMVTYNEFIRNTLGSLPYVGVVQSFLVLSQSKHETAFNL